MAHVLRLRVAEVEDPELGGLHRRACGVQRRHAPGDDVVYEREVALELRPARPLEDAHGLAVEDGPGEAVRSHVGAPPRPVHGKEAQPRDRYAVDVVVCVRQELVRLLGGGIKAGGRVSDVVLGERHLLVEAVDGGGRGVHHPRGRLLGLDNLEQGHESREVARHVAHGVLLRVAHAGLRGEVQDVRELARPEDLREGLGVVQVRVHRVHAVPVLQVARTAALEADGVVVVEVVQPEDTVATRPEVLRDTVPDKSGGACHEHDYAVALVCGRA
mmetsp:Transcript_11131/g.38673  ORF Transcript_11131/g.38673 Transcript_11131/m.38673 type:complete len:273 (-) Transcript_11131:41-859(-)